MSVCNCFKLPLLFKRLLCAFYSVLFSLSVSCFPIFQIEWYNICQDALNNVERLYQGKDTADIVQSKVLQVHSLVFSSLRYMIKAKKVLNVSLPEFISPLNKMFFFWAEAVKWEEQRSEASHGKGSKIWGL